METATRIETTNKVYCGYGCGFNATSYEVGNHMRDGCRVSRSPAANGSGPPANRVLDEAR